MKKFFLLAGLSICLPVWGQTPIRDFLNMKDSDTTHVTLHGVVESVVNPESGNLMLKDATGKVLLYRMLDKVGGTRPFRDLDILPGDTLSVWGCRSLYNTTIEMKTGRLVYHAKGPDHEKIKQKQRDEHEPHFKGGDMAAFEKWVAGHVKYPAGCSTEGTVVVKFVVGRNGKVQELEVVQKLDPLLDAEALRVVGSSPKWTPGHNYGKPVRTTKTIAVKFKRR